MSPSTELFLGIMSGTSLDGVDVICCRFTPDFSLLGQHHEPMPEALRASLFELQSPSTNEIHNSMCASVKLAELYATATKRLLANLSIVPEAVTAIGCHGQTIRHRPNDGYTLQINQPARLAELTGINVIADFRSRDIAAGGQGAPLVPAFHAAMFAHPLTHRVILNLGGMANLTSIPAGSKDITGFDCGPGNVLLDAWCQSHRGQPFDRDGAWGASGQVNHAFVQKLLAHPFLASEPPKSCGREEFNLPWLQKMLPAGISAVDAQASLLEFTACSAATAILDYCPGATEVFVCGGGARNSALVQSLSAHLPEMRLGTTEELGLAVDAVEATAFAWLACRFMHNEPGNLPAVTGALGLRRLGAFFPA